MWFVRAAKSVTSLLWRENNIENNALSVCRFMTGSVFGWVGFSFFDFNGCRFQTWAFIYWRSGHNCSIAGKSSRLTCAIWRAGTTEGMWKDSNSPSNSTMTDMRKWFASYYFTNLVLWGRVLHLPSLWAKKKRTIFVSRFSLLFSRDNKDREGRDLQVNERLIYSGLLLSFIQRSLQRGVEQQEVPAQEQTSRASQLLCYPRCILSE